LTKEERANVYLKNETCAFDAWSSKDDYDYGRRPTYLAINFDKSYKIDQLRILNNG